MKFLFIAFFFLVTTVNAQQVLTPELLWKLKRISGGTVSPNGKYILYNQKTYNVSENKGNNEIYIYDLTTGKSTQLTNTSGSESEAQWAANNTIWFISSESGAPQIYAVNPDGSDKKQISDFNNDNEIEGFKIAPDMLSVITIEAVKIKQAVTDLYPELPKADARIEDDLMYRHWNQWDDYKRRHLFYYPVQQHKIHVSAGKDLQKGEPFDAILPPFGGSEQFTFTNDGKKIVYTSKKLQGKEFAESTNSDLYEVDLSSGKTTLLTNGYPGYDINPSFSSEGKMAWLSMSHNGFESDKNDIILRDLKGIDHNLTKEIDLSVTEFCWHPDGKNIYFLSAIKGTVQIFEINVTSLKYRMLTNGPHDYVSLSITGDQLISGKQSMIAPTDLFSISIKKGTEKQLTAVNAELLSTVHLPTVKERWTTTTDGKKMLTWMVYPPDFDSTKTYPALLYCQGGPQSPVSQFFSYRWNLALMASNGYVIVAPNRRGLPGFGQEWNDAISKDWGGQAMQDYLSAIDDASTESYIDKNRLGAVGASYGGYSVYMLAGIHENRFKTFIAHCGLFNLESWYGTTEELFFANWDQGGPYWEEAYKENYRKNSPHNYVANWNTPIMVIHGGMDFRVPVSEGMQAYQAAQIKGIKSKFLYFPTEGHWIQSPQNSLVWQHEFFKWLAEDLK